MAIFKRGRTYWFHFCFNGEHVQQSTKQGNPRVARQIEAAHRTRLAKGEVGIVEKKAPAPTLRTFAERFKDSIKVRSAEKPQTIRFYLSKLDRLLEFEALASARLDVIDEQLIETYVQLRRKTVSPASVNRELATLRRLLGLAYQWKVIGRIPVVTKLDGERSRDFVLSRELEKAYLEIAQQPLKDAALLLLDTGLRVGELVALAKSDIHLDKSNGSKFGYLRVKSGKSKNATRAISLTARASEMLRIRMAGNESPWVFPGERTAKIAFLSTSLDGQHSRVRTTLGLPNDFVLHSLRHTFLTRLGEAGVDAFTLMRIAGHSMITVSQKYVHPSSEAMERAFQKLEASNAPRETKTEPKSKAPATVSATLAAVASDSIM
ncbi:MAG: tyrosine-type recombinase/integrase [Acidobacteriota bacterium]